MYRAFEKGNIALVLTVKNGLTVLLMIDTHACKPPVNKKHEPSSAARETKKLQNIVPAAAAAAILYYIIIIIIIIRGFAPE